MPNHDFAAQRQETYAAFAELQAEDDLPEEAELEFAFTAGLSANWDVFEAALLDEGHQVERYLTDDQDPDFAPYILASLPDHPISALAIWMSEEHITRIALAHGFTPDGWGFTG